MCLERGIDPAAVRKTLRDFAGVEHRMEHVADIGGVEYVNDSKATNVTAAAAALRSFDGRRARDPRRLAEGRRVRGACRRVVAERCRACYLIGEAAAQLAEDLADTGVELVRCGDLERAEIEASQARTARRGRAACAGLRELRPVPRLRGAR